MTDRMTGSGSSPNMHGNVCLRTISPFPWGYRRYGPGVRDNVPFSTSLFIELEPRGAPSAQELLAGSWDRPFL